MWAQTPSQIMMMNGRTYNVKLKELAPPTIQFTLDRKPTKFSIWLCEHRPYPFGLNVFTYCDNKTISPAIQKVFSITDSTGKKTFIYRQDSLYGNYFSVPDMQNFIYGFNDGRRYRYGGDFAIGFVSGVGGSFFGPIYGWGVPILATTINVTIKPNVTAHVKKLHPVLEFDSFYLAGARRKIRNRKMWGTMFGSAAGMAVGTLLFQVLIRNPFSGE
jgi:hypothetical protein